MKNTSFTFSLLLAFAFCPAHASPSGHEGHRVFHAAAPEWLATSWTLVAHKQGGGKKLFKDDRPMRLDISINSLKVTGGCNQKIGQFRFENNRLITESLQSTMMACSPEILMEKDDTMARVLTSNPDIVRKGKFLVLKTKNGEELLFVKTPSQK